jgi:pimeloyl-ACP methyl ester carboxylesterase
MKSADRFREPMASWPNLEAYSHRVRLPESQVNLHCYRAGDPQSPAVLLIHGLGDEADTWRKLLPALSETAHVIAPDLPGFGRSDKPRRSYTIEFFLQAILELTQTLPAAPMTLVGHSLGAMLSQAFALKYPERVSRLVLLAGGLAASVSKIDIRTLAFLVPGLGEWMYNRLRKDPISAYRSLLPYYSDFESLPQMERDFLYQRVNQRVWSDGQRDAFLSTLRNMARWLPAQQKSLSSQLESFEVPTLAIWGEADQISDIANGHALKRLQPSARLVAVPGAGHNLHQENPQAVLEALAGIADPTQKI